MIILAFEGLDHSGKATQSKLLNDYLEAKGYHVTQLGCHNYDTPTGKLIQRWLYEDYDVDQKTIELIISADKQQMQKWFDDFEKSGVDVLILDRYTSSQQVYSEASGIDPSWTKELERYMRQPDCEIYIDISAEESLKRKGKFGENDRYEKDLEFLKRVRNLYVKQSGINRWIIEGLQDIENVHKDIVHAVEDYLFEKELFK